jgi:branched-chain amino acid transport system permease protein
MESVMRGLVRRGGFWVGVLAATAFILPLLVSSAFVIDIFIRVLLFAFVGVAWNLVGGYAKQLSLGHAAYFGLGAYTSTILLIRYGVSPWIGMLAGGIVAMAASLPIGALCFRLRGPYFAIATIATAQVLMLLFLKFRDFAWGAEGTTIPNFGDSPLMMQFDEKAPYYYIVLALLAVSLAVTYRIERSWMGYYLVAVGEDEDAAEAIGVDALRIKRNIYLISAFLTALAGTFYVQYIYFIDPNTAFSFNISVEAALVSIIGGIGTLWGPVVGTVLLEATSALLQSWLGGGYGGVQLTVYSLILMAVILYRPTGLIGVLTDAYDRIVHLLPTLSRPTLPRLRGRVGRGQTKKVSIDG